ncbi:MAG: amidohydrolase [Alphaproteobacteria bacterium TMED89]|nr:amidohydrolase [Rhodospirillaceae bacterium]RPH12488.1 MAG: amidohydrolase [Alphaproteobacteria bacterium TMED89]
MPLINSLADHLDDIRAWRHEIHAHPELQYEVHRTAALVAEKLNEFGLDEVVTGIGRTGVVGVIRGKGQDSGKTIGLRADMDALPIQEVRDLPHKSQIDGSMHACGHDGHTAMLLGAARHLAENRDFDGTVVVIFQPAEEGGAGGKAMVDDGLMERFGIQEIYGMHNVPGLPVGAFATKVGPIMAAADLLEITVEGKGAHAAMPDNGVDSVVVAAALVGALQSIVSRNVDPLDQAVVSITQIHAGDAFNVIPQVAELAGTVRTFQPKTRDLVERRIEEICAGVAATYGASITAKYHRNYPATINHPAETDFAVSVAADIVGEGSVNPNMDGTMGGEDFSFMLLERPGNFIFVGNGDTAGLHHPEYDFNDEVIPYGCSYWISLIERAMPLTA